jgi:hypothetical protein
MIGLTALTLLCVRWNIVLRNVLWWDDFAVPHSTTLIYLGSYRPVLFAEYHLWETMIPGHFWAGFPKWASLAYATAAVVLLSRFLRRLGITPSIAIGCSLLVGVHPIATDALFWSSLSGMGLALVFTVLGAEQIWFGRGVKSVGLGTGLLTLGALGYQWLLVVGMVLLAGAACTVALRGEPIERRRIWKAILVIGVAATLVWCWMAVTRALMPVFDQRGWPPAGSFSAAVLRRYHGWADNLVNVFMPPIAATAGFRQAWSLWKWVPISWTALAVAAGVLGRLRGWRLLTLSLLPAALSAMAASFTLVLPFSTYAWRTSLAALVGFAVGVAAAGTVLERLRWGRLLLFVWGGAFFLGACFATGLDDGRRAEGYFNAVRAEGGGKSPSGATGQESRAGADEDFGGRALTTGYEPMGRRVYSPYVDEWVTLRFREFLAEKKARRQSE